jgi:Ni,Fe-hydrogenase III small subunit/Pyruvate/2-oxoacid:ferredoxin oxidoreductase delta subunit
MTESLPTQLPANFRGLPVIHQQHCATGCDACTAACPTQAIRRDNRGLLLDLGRCLFCTDCQDACPPQAISLSAEHRLASFSRSALVLEGSVPQVAQELPARAIPKWGRSLALRHISAGSCNGCEMELQQLNSVCYELARYGVRFVTSPRHADGLLITGPITKAMEGPLLRAYEAVPAPKVVIALGACAISGGPFLDHPEQNNGADRIVPVDLYIPGCPPHPQTILEGLLQLLNQL